MKSKYIKSAIFSLGILGVSIYQINGNSSGASSPNTGAPNENSCNSCHTGSSLVTSGSQHARIQLKGTFTGSGYIPDSTYTLTLTYAETGKSTFGFQMTALSNGKAAGTFTSSNRTGTFSSNVNGATRYYVEHNSTGSSGIATDSTAWTFQWKAPSTNVGNITFYAALNSSNGNGSSSGDVIYNKTFSISPSTLLPKATASLKSTLTCAGTTLEFEGNGNNNTTAYSWSFPTGTPSSSSLQNPKISFANAGTHLAILTVTNNKGSSLKDTLKFNVLDAAIKPNLNIRTATTVLCLGDTLDFSIGTTQRHTYTWNNGVTGRNNRVISGGFVGVTALRDNGCSVNSDSVFVIGVPKPKFIVSYGFSTDSICVNETLLVLLKNQGVADSYSRVSSQGPYSRDSFLTYPISQGTNSFQYWAKNSLGCVSDPSKTTVFHGVDTPSAPVLNVLSRLSDKILFEWNKIQHAESYEYSLNKGITWEKVDSLQAQKQWVMLDSATQLVEFWIRAKTGNFCTHSHIGRIQARGAGCNEPQWSVSSTSSVICKDSSLSLIILGLGVLEKYQLEINGNIYTDTIYTETLKSNRSYKILLLDSQQLLCGSFEKVIDIPIDKPAPLTHSYSPQNKILLCGGDENTDIPLSFSNFNSAYTYTLITDNEVLTLDSSNLIRAKLGKSTWILKGKTENECPLIPDTLMVYSDKIPDTRFDANWINEFQYEFVALESDTNNYVHYWIDSVTNMMLNLENTSRLIQDYGSIGEGTVYITHQMQPKQVDTNFNLSECNYQNTQKVEIRNLSNFPSESMNTAFLFPNPVKSMSAIQCDNCSTHDRFELWSMNGSFLGSYELSELKKQTLSSGLYIVVIYQNDRQYVQKINIGD